MCSGTTASGNSLRKSLSKPATEKMSSADSRSASPCFSKQSFNFSTTLELPFTLKMPSSSIPVHNPQAFTIMYYTTTTMIYIKANEKYLALHCNCNSPLANIKRQILSTMNGTLGDLKSWPSFSNRLVWACDWDLICSSKDTPNILRVDIPFFLFPRGELSTCLILSIIIKLAGDYAWRKFSMPQHII